MEEVGLSDLAHFSEAISYFMNPGTPG